VRASRSRLLLGPKWEQIIYPEVILEVFEKVEIVFFEFLDAFQFLDRRFALRSSATSWPSCAVSLQLSVRQFTNHLGDGGSHVRRAPDGMQVSGVSGDISEYLLEIWCTREVGGDTSWPEYKVCTVPNFAPSLLAIQYQEHRQRAGQCIVVTID
jgi:hypothetical protein